MEGNVLNNIWQFLFLLAFFPQQAYSGYYYVYVFKCMSTHIHTNEIRSLKQDEKSQMQAMDVLHFYIKDNPLGNLTTLQLQNI